MQQWNIDRLKPFPNNARTHSPEQVQQLVASIKEWGWTVPVLVTPEGVIVAGHGRVQAARALGMEQVPVLVADGWTDAQVRAYVLADNKLALNAGWDESLLAIELGDLKALEFDVGAIGFSAGELSALLKKPGATDPDEAPPVPPVPVSRAGDLWVMGGHRLLCGDSTKAADVARLMGGAKAALMVTDPPYGVDYDGSGANPKWGKHDKITNDALGADQAGFWKAAFAAQQINGDFYIFAPSRPLLFDLAEAVKAAGLEVRQVMVWVKDRLVLGRSHYHYRHEHMLYGWHGKSSYNGARDEDSVWECPRPSRSDDHPTMKPVALVERAVKNSSEHGNIVLDPFSGSGTTIIAAEMTGRACYALEIAPQYVDVAVLRWQAFTGQGAILDGDGRTFEEIKLERTRTEAEAAA